MARPPRNQLSPPKTYLFAAALPGKSSWPDDLISHCLNRGKNPPWIDPDSCRRILDKSASTGRFVVIMGHALRNGAVAQAERATAIDPQRRGDRNGQIRSG